MRIRLAVAALVAGGGLSTLVPLAGVPFAQSILWAQRLSSASPRRVETLSALGGIAPDVVGQFREPTGFTRVDAGHFLVFDRRGHAVYSVDSSGGSSSKIVQIGGEDGRVIDPSAFSAAPDGRFAVADAPNGRERVQVFDAAGRRVSGFILPGKITTCVVLGSITFGGWSRSPICTTRAAKSSARCSSVAPGSWRRRACRSRGGECW